MPKQQRRTFTSAFKKQMVELYENGKSRAAIVDIFHKNRKAYGTTFGSQAEASSVVR